MICPATPAPASYLTAAQVATRLGVNKRTFFRMVAAGEFPAGLRRNRRWVRWTEDDFARYHARLEARRAAVPPAASNRH
jgi:excisionase family DNA binding protein